MHHASLLVPFRNYSSTADAAHRAAYRAAAENASSIYATPLLTFYTIVLPSMGVLLASITMIKARFGKASAWTGVITGAFGLLSLAGFFPLVMANALGATLWFFLVGARLLRSAAKRRRYKMSSAAFHLYIVRRPVPLLYIDFLEILCG